MLALRIVRVVPKRSLTSNCEDLQLLVVNVLRQIELSMLLRQD